MNLEALKEFCWNDRLQHHGEFEPVLGEIQFPKNKALDTRVRKLPECSCVYLWLLVAQDKKFVVYLGKAKNLRSRTKDYVRGFQPYAPNDFKVQLFDWYVSTKLRLTEHSYELLWHRYGEDELSSQETTWIRRLRPVLNEKAIRQQPDEQERIAGIYRKHYAKILGLRLTQ